MLSVTLPNYLPAAPDLIQQIQVYQQSGNAFDRQVRTRLCVAELFLRIVFKAIQEGLSAIVKSPFAITHVVLGRLSPAAMTFSEVGNHVQLFKRCTAAALWDSFGILINPNAKDIYSRLVNRNLIEGQRHQVTPTFFESLRQHVWRHKGAILGGIAVVVIMAIAIQRLNLLSPLINRLTQILPNVTDQNTTNIANSALNNEKIKSIVYINEKIFSYFDPTPLDIPCLISSVEHHKDDFFMKYLPTVPVLRVVILVYASVFTVIVSRSCIHFAKYISRKLIYYRQLILNHK